MCSGSVLMHERNVLVYIKSWKSSSKHESPESYSKDECWEWECILLTSLMPSVKCVLGWMDTILTWLRKSSIRNIISIESCVIVRLCVKNMLVALGKGIFGEGRPVHVNLSPNSLYIDKFILTPFHQTLTNKPFLETSLHRTNPPNPLTSTSLACTHPKFAP